jgi:hypothetical protein
MFGKDIKSVFVHSKNWSNFVRNSKQPPELTFQQEFPKTSQKQ